MKIDGSNPFPETTSATFRHANVPGGTTSNEVSETPDTDGASISTGSSVSALAAQIKQMPDIRQERVAALRQAVQSGQYQVSDEQIADALHAQLLGTPGSSTE
jgi:negative regulator of flagellin synthesis FlgM